MYKYIIASIFLLSINVHAQQKLTKDDLNELKNRVEGNFDNNEQASLDNSYHNITLHIKEFELKGKHSEGIYLYVEASLSDHPHQPNTQFIYRLYRQKDTLVCEVNELNSPNRIVGAWNNTDMLKKLTKDSLLKKEGCTIYFMKDDNGDYYGSTRGEGCSNSEKGASYTTKEVVVFPSLLISWDRGWNDNNHQVWGAEKGGYRFRKFTNPHALKD